MRLPAADPSVIARRAELASALRLAAPGVQVLDRPPELAPYECDALAAYRQTPLLVALPGSTAEVAAVVRFCWQNDIKIVPRGAGTSLSGGALPLADGLVLGLAKLNRITEIDYANRCVVAQPGVTNLAISEAVAGRGFFYAPDPSSQIACTIGGNVAENSGGVHCVKYGLTTNNLLGLEMVLPDGEILRLGGKAFDAAGYDLLGVITGSEGLLGIVTEVTVRILPTPSTARAVLLAFGSHRDAADCVAAIMGSGIVPAGLEMMDKPAIIAAEAYVHAGYPTEAEAILIVEVDGSEAEADLLAARVAAIAQSRNVLSMRTSANEAERLRFWAGRKAAFPAVGRLAPDYFCMDGTIPRGKLAEVLEEIGRLSARFGLGVANVFHAGDGNLHPLILFDANRPGDLEKAEELGAEILKLCVRVGGVLTGEHGVGVEKRDLMGEMFDEFDLAQQQRLKCAFDPKGLFNPGKVFPLLHRCVELGRMHVERGAMPFPDLPRF